MTFPRKTIFLPLPNIPPPAPLLSQHTSIFLCFAMSVTFVLLKQASPFPICMQKGVCRLVCTDRFSLTVKLFEFRFSSTCLDRYQQTIQVIASAHFSKINHISLCDWNVWIQNFYSTWLLSLSFTSHFERMCSRLQLGAHSKSSPSCSVKFSTKILHKTPQFETIRLSFHPWVSPLRGSFIPSRQPKFAYSLFPW